MIILASTSPTRAKILTEHHIPFVQKPTFFDEETIVQTDPLGFVYSAALGKANDACFHYSTDLPLLCADTVVSSQGYLLRKAYTKDEAKKILLLQSGQCVTITTCTILYTSTLKFIDISETHYHFYPFDEQALETYLESYEWEGKAGACMVEGFCQPFIKSVEGLQSCAMGLTLEKVIPFLPKSPHV